jgi:hypothetical protein
MVAASLELPEPDATGYQNPNATKSQIDQKWCDQVHAATIISRKTLARAARKMGEDIGAGKRVLRYMFG